MKAAHQENVFKDLGADYTELKNFTNTYIHTYLKSFAGLIKNFRRMFSNICYRICIPHKLMQKIEFLKFCAYQHKKESLENRNKQRQLLVSAEKRLKAPFLFQLLISLVRF